MVKKRLVFVFLSIFLISFVIAQDYKLEISTAKESFEAGENITLKISLLDSSNKPINDNVNIILEDAEKNLKIEKIIQSNKFVDINLGEDASYGQGTITALSKVPGYLLIFKERSLKRWNGQSTFPDDLSKLGTNSQESVILGKRTVFYFSSGYAESVGFYETNGEESRKISRPIQDIVDAIDSSYYDDVAGFSDGENAMWSIGDIIWDGITYSNAVVMYHFDSQTWTLLTFPTQYKVFSQYIDGNDLEIVAGDDDGQVIEVFKSATYTDTTTDAASAAISYSLQYHPNDFGSRSLMKEIVKVIPHTEDLTGAVFSYRIDKKQGSGFRTFGTVTDNYTDEITGRIAGHVIEFRYSGTSSAGGEIIGFDVINPEVSLSVKY